MMQGHRLVVLELLDAGLITDQKQVVAASLLEKTIGQLCGCLEMPFDVREPMALLLARPQWVGRSRQFFTDRLELLFVSELEDGERHLVHSDIKDQNLLLLIHDRLEGSDIRNAL